MTTWSGWTDIHGEAAGSISGLLEACSTTAGPAHKHASTQTRKQRSHTPSQRYRAREERGSGEGRKMQGFPNAS